MNRTMKSTSTSLQQQQQQNESQTSRSGKKVLGIIRALVSSSGTGCSRIMETDTNKSFDKSNNMWTSNLSRANSSTCTLELKMPKRKGMDDTVLITIVPFKKGHPKRCTIETSQTLGFGFKLIADWVFKPPEDDEVDNPQFISFPASKVSKYIAFTFYGSYDYSNSHRITNIEVKLSTSGLPKVSSDDSLLLRRKPIMDALLENQTDDQKTIDLHRFNDFSIDAIEKEVAEIQNSYRMVESSQESELDPTLSEIEEGVKSVVQKHLSLFSESPSRNSSEEINDEFEEPVVINDIEHLDNQLREKKKVLRKKKPVAKSVESITLNGPQPTVYSTKFAPTTAPFYSESEDDRANVNEKPRTKPEVSRGRNLLHTKTATPKPTQTPQAISRPKVFDLSAKKPATQPSFQFTPVYEKPTPVAPVVKDFQKEQKDFRMKAYANAFSVSFDEVLGQNSKPEIVEKEQEEDDIVEVDLSSSEEEDIVNEFTKPQQDVQIPKQTPDKTQRGSPQKTPLKSPQYQVKNLKTVQYSPEKSLFETLSAKLREQENLRKELETIQLSFESIDNMQDQSKEQKGEEPKPTVTFSTPPKARTPSSTGRMKKPITKTPAKVKPAKVHSPVKEQEQSETDISVDIDSEPIASPTFVELRKKIDEEKDQIERVRKQRMEEREKLVRLQEQELEKLRRQRQAEEEYLRNEQEKRKELSQALMKSTPEPKELTPPKQIEARRATPEQPVKNAVRFGGEEVIPIHNEQTEEANTTNIATYTTEQIPIDLEELLSDSGITEYASPVTPLPEPKRTPPSFGLNLRHRELMEQLVATRSEYNPGSPWKPVEEIEVDTGISIIREFLTPVKSIVPRKSPSKPSTPNNVVMPYQSPVKLKSSPITSPSSYRANSPVRSPLRADTPPKRTPMKTPVKSPVYSPQRSVTERSPGPSLSRSPMHSPVTSTKKTSSIKSPMKSPMKSPLKSPIKSPEKSPVIPPFVRNQDNDLNSEKLPKEDDNDSLTLSDMSEPSEEHVKTLTPVSSQRNTLKSRDSSAKNLKASSSRKNLEIRVEVPEENQPLDPELLERHGHSRNESPEEEHSSQDEEEVEQSVDSEHKQEENLQGFKPGTRLGDFVIETASDGRPVLVRADAQTNRSYSPVAIKSAAKQNLWNINFMRKGTTFEKYHYKTSSSNPRIIKLDATCTYLSIQKLNRYFSKPTKIPISDIQWIVYGPNTSVLRAAKSGVRYPWNYFSLVMNNRTIDLEVHNESDADVWILGIQSLIHKNIIRNNRPLYTKGKLCFMRLRMKLKHQSMEEKVSVERIICEAVRKSAKSKVEFSAKGPKTTVLSTRTITPVSPGGYISDSTFDKRKIGLKKPLRTTDGGFKSFSVATPSSSRINRFS